MVESVSTVMDFRARASLLRREILILPEEISELEESLEEYACTRRRKVRLEKRIRTDTPKRDDEYYRQEALNMEKSFRPQNRIFKKIMRKRGRLVEAKRELCDMVFDLAMIPLSYRPETHITTIEKASGRIYHLYIGKRSESATGVLHGHVVVDENGYLRYARWPGEKRGKENYLGRVPAKKYYDDFMSRPENKGSDLYLEIEYSKYIDFEFPTDEELMIPEIP